MSAAIIGAVALLLIALGVGIYFLVTAKKCKEHKTQDDCKEPCQWDTYGNKCIDEDGELTDAPVIPTPPPPPSCSSYTTQDTCLSPCEWNSMTNMCGTGTPTSPSDNKSTRTWPAGVNPPEYCVETLDGVEWKDYFKLHSRYGGGTGPQGTEFFNSKAYQRMAYATDSDGIYNGKARGWELNTPSFTSADDHATNIVAIYNDIVRGENGKKPQFLAVQSRYIEYPSSGQSWVWKYTMDKKYKPGRNAQLNFDDPWCKGGRNYLRIGLSSSDSSAVHYKGNSSTWIVYDVREGIDKFYSYSCRRPNEDQPGGEAYDFVAIGRNELKANQHCISEMNCGSSDECYATMGRGDSTKFGCLKCTKIANSAV